MHFQCKTLVMSDSFQPCEKITDEMVQEYLEHHKNQDDINNDAFILEKWFSIIDQTYGPVVHSGLVFRLSFFSFGFPINFT